MSLLSSLRPHRARLIAASLLLAALVVAPTALLPPLLATLLAVVTRRLVPSLLIAVLVGGVALYGWAAAVPELFRAHVLGRLTSAWHLQVMGFTCVLLGIVRITTASGGAQALVDRVCFWVRSARSTRIATVLLGCAVFFDDYANCLLVGPAVRPLSDRYRISREKLAYLVDSTAAPVAGLALVSTWVGYEVGLFAQVGSELGLALGGFGLLVLALPFRFYCVFALLTAALCAALGRDFGPMLRAERQASSSTAPAGEASGEGLASVASLVSVERRRARHAFLPLLALLGALLVFLLRDAGALGLLLEQPGAVASGAFWKTTLAAVRHPTETLFRASLVGAVVALVLPTAEGALRVGETARAFTSGAISAAQAIGILLSAWALSAVCGDLGTGVTLIDLVGGQVAPLLVPVMSFLLAAAVGFATGTSFGTMALLIPVCLPLAHATGSELLLVATAASVLDGAIFGDHASPISDTTVMASIGAGCDHLSHVSTQLPYASLSMVTAVVAGYLPASLGAPLPVCYGVGALALLAVFRFVGRPAVS